MFEDRTLRVNHVTAMVFRPPMVTMMTPPAMMDAVMNDVGFTRYVVRGFGGLQPSAWPSKYHSQQG